MRATPGTSTLGPEPSDNAPDHASGHSESDWIRDAPIKGSYAIATTCASRVVVRAVFAERHASGDPNDDASGNVRVSGRRVYFDGLRRWGLRRNGHAYKRIDRLGGKNRPPVCDRHCLGDRHARLRPNHAHRAGTENRNERQHRSAMNEAAAPHPSRSDPVTSHRLARHPLGY